MKYYSKSKLNSIYEKMITVFFSPKGYGKSYHEELKKNKNSKIIRRKFKEEKTCII